MKKPLRILNFKTTMTPYRHTPVLEREVLAAFDTPTLSFLVDGTLGLGGHSEKLLQHHPTLNILGLDWDREALALAQERLKPFGSRFEGVEWSYAQLPELLRERGIAGIDGVLVDLGLSSMQLQDTSRGFSFLRPGPLDMRMSHALPRTAWDVLTTSDEDQLVRLFQEFGEERSARRIARALKEAQHYDRLKNDAWDVAQLIRQAAPTYGKGTDPATRCFQALRIVVNGELDNIDLFLENLSGVLNPGGRAAMIAFHSLEDRRVKRFFLQAAKGCVCPPQIPQCMCGIAPWARRISTRAIQPSDEEIEANPRARSARLRILEKL